MEAKEYPTAFDTMGSGFVCLLGAEYRNKGGVKDKRK